jgi:hypothetical protein
MPSSAWGLQSVPDPVAPWRFAIANNNCNFLIVPLSQEIAKYWLPAIQQAN